MELIKRIIEDQVIENLTPQKVIILLGPRRVGKTILIKQVLEKVNEPYLLLNGEDFSVVEILERRSAKHYKNVLGGKKTLLIDEAQKIPEIGKVLKLMVDEIKDRNRIARITVNCVGVGNPQDNTTLSALARACDGEYVQIGR